LPSSHGKPGPQEEEQEDEDHEIGNTQDEPTLGQRMSPEGCQGQTSSHCL